MSMFQSLYIASDSLRINQSAMAVINNNIANMNTEGYSKQRIDLAQGKMMPGSVYEKMTLPIGGVEVDSITRYSNAFLDTYYRQENSALGYYDEMANSLVFIEEYFNEIDGTGISGAMADFYAAAQDLSMEPSNQIIRSSFMQEANQVANEFNATYQQLINYRDNVVGDGTTSAFQSSELYNTIEDANIRLTKIAELNDQIESFQVQSGATPNTLLDERDKLLNELSEIMPVSIIEEDNMFNLYLGKMKLIEGSVLNGEFKAELQPPVPPETISSEPAVVSFGDDSFVLVEDFAQEFPGPTGKLSAILELGGSGPTSIHAMIEDLNLLAQEFATTINDIQIRGEESTVNPPRLSKSSMCMDGATKQLIEADQYIFLDDQATTTATYDPTLITAGNIQVNDSVLSNPFLIATAYVDVDDTVAQPPIVALDPNAIGDNDNIFALAESRNTSNPNLSGYNVEDKMSAIIAEVGTLTSAMLDSKDVQVASVDHVNEQKQSVVGVNLDEELVDMVKYQNSYNASARIFSVINDMLGLMMSLLQ